MAIITCPYCGKQTSNTNEICYHCGNEWAKKPTEEANNKEDYNNLSLAEKTNLRQEFYEKYPKYYKIYKRNRFWDSIKYIVRIIASIELLLMCLIRLSAMLSKSDNSFDIDNSVWLKITMIIFLALLIILILLPLAALALKSKRRYRAMLIEKKYQSFIFNEKNMNYTVQFDSKDKKAKQVFEKIDLEYEEL